MLIPSSKTGADKYDLRSVDPDKIYPRIDARLLGDNIKNLSEQTLGYSLSGDEGSSQAQVPLLSVIDTANIATYNKLLPQFISTLISNGNLLDVDGASTANSIILNPHNISPGLSPNGTDYSQAASLPFAYKDGLSFTFKATASNSLGVVINIPGLAGLAGAAEALNEGETALVQGDIIVNKYYTIVCKTISSVKKFILKQPSIAPATNVSSGAIRISQPITIANDTLDPNNDIVFSSGNFIFSDFSGQAVASAPQIKRLDASWVAGTNQGGLFSGVKAINTVYYLFKIYDPVNNLTDSGFSTSSIAADRPVAYSNFRYMGAMRTNPAGNIRRGRWFRDGRFLYNESAGILDATFNLTAVAQTTAISTPPIPNIRSLISANLRTPNGGTQGAFSLNFLLYTNYTTNTTVTASNSDGFMFIGSDPFGNAWSEFPSNTLKEINLGNDNLLYFKCDVAKGTFTMNINTLGWIDLNI